MKKITFTVFMATMLLTTISTPIIAQEKNEVIVASVSETDKAEQANAMQLRLDEINSMDKSNLTSSEKKELRKEVKEIKKASSGGGIYFSAGALIVILIILIILL